MSSAYRSTVYFILFVVVVVFAEGSVPYWCGVHFAPEGYKFSGMVTYAPDQNMYFSFISQANEGAFVLGNKLTDMLHQPVFVNLEFWLVGWVQRMFGLSQNAVYHVWRFFGVLLMGVGFGMLAGMLLPDVRRQRVAVAVFFLTGGFGFVFAILDALHLISFEVLQLGILDMYFGILPLQQTITNPHFSFPHGLILIAYAFFVKGERSGNVWHYVWCGVMFNIIGLVRPYDIIPPVVIFPLYALAVNGGWRIDVRQWLVRMLPLFMIVPVFLYNVWLFSVHPVFKYWASQGHNAGNLPAIHWHYMVYGVVGIVAIVRLGQAMRQRLGHISKFMLLWFGVTFMFIQLGKVVPALGWSPQIGVYLAAPLTLAACSLQLGAWAYKRSVRMVVLPIVILVLVVSNVSVVAYHCRKFVLHTNAMGFYTSVAELDAMKWLQQQHKAGEVVLADIPSSLHIARYTSYAVVAAHYSVSPRFAQQATMAASLLADTLITTGSIPLPDTVRVQYLYIKNDSLSRPASMPYLTKVYTNKEVTILKVK